MTTSTLILGDCLERLPSIPDGSIDLILTDPPYGTTACKWDSVIPFEPMWKQVWRVLKPNGAAVFTSSQPFTSALVMSQIERFRYCWVWEKTQATGFLDAKRKPLKAHEDVCVFSTGRTVYYPQKTEGHERKVSLRKHKENTLKNQTDVYGKSDEFSDYDSTERYPRSVVVFKSDKQKSSLHPTQKPVALMEYLIKTYTNEGETVLDFTAGSFTTGVAALRTGRKFIGIERDADYFKIGVRRLCDEVRALSLCGTTDRDILNWKVDWPFHEIQNPYTALCDELVSNLR